VAPAWQADTSASFVRRLGKSAKELGQTDDKEKCPDLWLLDNGDVAVVGFDCTEAYRARMPEDMILSTGERLVVIPGVMLRAARPDIPDA